jgi:predicted dehydrogenase
VSATSSPDGANLVTVRPDAAPLRAPAPRLLPGKVIVRRVHAHVPRGFFTSAGDARQKGWIARLLERYPAPLRKAIGYLRKEGLRQTWIKIRTRSTLERWNAAYGVFAAVGVVVEASDGGLRPGTAVLCWSWQGALDADLHLASPEQCLPVSGLVPEYALAPFLGWIVSVLRAMETGIASFRLAGIDPALEGPLHELLGPRDPKGKRLVIGWGAGLTSSLGAGEFPVRLLPQRAIEPLVTSGSSDQVCHLPDPSHYFLDPLFPGPPEMPEPFGRQAVAEALNVLTRTYPASSEARVPTSPAALAAQTLSLSRRGSPRAGALGVSCLGAGNYVRAVLFHHLRRCTPVHVRGVMDVRPEVAAAQARALRSTFCTTDPEAVFADAGTDLVLIASDHASHADYAVSALRAGKAVHLEKPPAVTSPQLERLLQCLGEVERPRLSLGYNRPFAPVVIDLWKVLAPLDGPTRVDFTVQGYRLGRAHWYRWPDQGTRIAGNLVHWIDLGYRLVGRPLPSWVDVAVPTDPSEAERDAILLSVGFEDESRITIRFSSGGDETWGIHEHVRVEKQNLTAEIDDFLSLRVSRAGLDYSHRYRRDKGHAAFVQALALRMRDGKWDPGMVTDTARACAIQLAAQAALADGGGRKQVSAFLPVQGR